MKKLLITLFMTVLGLAFLGLMAGCPPSSSDDDDDDDAADDDDASDDDGADDDMTDDDGGDDDGGDDDTWPDTPTGFSIDVTFSASGTTSTTNYTHNMLNSNYDPICAVDFEFTGTLATGPGQGNDYYQYIDEVIVWTGGGEVANNCPAEWGVYKGEPIDYFMWDMHPLAFVSCDLVAQVGGLGTTFVGEDPTEAGDGTFGEYCTLTGPSLESALGTGPMEALWLAPGLDGSLDPLGNYAYFAPADTGNVEVWLIMGVLMADAANTAEPVDGLDGDYVTVPFWLWLYA